MTGRLSHCVVESRNSRPDWKHVFEKLLNYAVKPSHLSHAAEKLSYFVGASIHPMLPSVIRVTKLDEVTHEQNLERQYLWRSLWRQRPLQLYRRKVS
jgi:hypothetical protein